MTSDCKQPTNTTGGGDSLTVQLLKSYINPVIAYWQEHDVLLVGNNTEHLTQLVVCHYLTSID